uniref:DUF4371 domain-containing protein n=1 Tax=Pelodiscus sinensis TaxID=13735 RepID=K7FBQ8_PELSI
IKKRQYDEDYMKYGFTVMEKNGFNHPQCTVCHTVLSNDALRPSRLEQHLMKNHSALTDKPREFFAAKLQNLKCLKLDITGSFHQVSAKVVEASYELSLLIVKAKKAHIIGETLVKLCLLKAADILLGVKSKKTSLSDNSVKRCIDDLAKDLKLQVVEAVLASPFFTIQCDDTTDVARYRQLLIYIRLINDGTVKEELMTTSKASDVMKMISDFLKKRLSWGKLVDVCTEMVGSCSGFVTLVKEKNTAITTTHCDIHGQALVAKTLPDDLHDSLNLAIKVVNFVKNSALNTRLFAALCTDLGADHKTLLFHTKDLPGRKTSLGQINRRVLPLRHRL